MSTVIKVENLSKQYRLGLVGTSTFKEDTQRWWAKLRGKEDPFLNLGVENDRTLKTEEKFVWSLKDINFEVKQGDVLGVIGRNGAGKSTLLKILSKVTAPTIGSVKVKGRIASLLEVGTGFHPELTGRENIYLNGAILGMRKNEIKQKLDEIIAFAGVEKYVDTPVKRYSSGMYVRLAFAVAAHLESEILIVDEVLAVGDLDFQKKCLGKMNDISQSQGRTVIFVSHNISSIQTLCSNGILLNNGRNVFNGNVTDTVNNYLSDFSSNLFTNILFKKNKNDIQIDSSCLLNSEMVENGVFDLGDKVFVQINYTVSKPVRGVNFCLVLKRNGVELICSFDSDVDLDVLNKTEIGSFGYIVDLETDELKAGNYTVSLDIGLVGLGIIEKHDDVLSFCIKEFKEETSSKGYSESRVGFLYKKLKWKKIKYSKNQK